MSNENLPLTTSPSVLPRCIVELKNTMLYPFKRPALCVEVRMCICMRIHVLASGKGNPLFIRPLLAKLNNQREAEDAVNFDQ